MFTSQVGKDVSILNEHSHCTPKRFEGTYIRWTTDKDKINKALIVDGKARCRGCRQGNFRVFARLRQWQMLKVGLQLGAQVKLSKTTWTNMNKLRKKNTKTTGSQRRWQLHARVWIECFGFCLVAHARSLHAKPQTETHSKRISPLLKT